MSRIVLPLLVLTGLPAPGYGQVVLNEIMASNQQTIVDEDGDFPDWIELYNAGSSAVQLLDHGLSDDYDNPFRWRFPAVTLQPGQFLFVWASGKDRRIAGHPLHTNFSISAAGEEVLLTDPGGNRIDEVPPTPIPADISLGRQPDGTGDWFYFKQPTPGGSNTTEGFQDVLDPPAFSHTAGFYTSGFTLSLTSSDPSAVIRYTLDGSEPTLDSPVFDGALEIIDRAGEPNGISSIRTYYNSATWLPPSDDVFKASVVRARAFRPGAVSSEVVTRTFIVHPSGHARYSLPVVSVATDAAGLFDHHRGIYVPGVYYQPGNAWTGNYFQRGDAWERPISIEMFEVDGSLAFSQNAGVRIHGGFSRALPFKTLRIYARRQYDEENWIEYPIFPDRPINRFKRFLLRNAGNDWGGHPWATYNNSEPGTLFRDPLMQRLVEHLGFDTQGYRPAIVFINGEYWGIHNFRQRYDQHYFDAHYGIAEDELDLLTDQVQTKVGSTVHYDALMSFVNANDMSDPAALRYVQTLMDVDNFFDYYISNIYFDNTDWPHKNLDYWRYRRDGFNPGTLPGRDGRWRWAMYDTDFGFGLGGDHNPGASHRRNTMAHAARPHWSTRLFTRLLQNERLRNDFINRFADHLNSTFAGDRVVAVIDEMQAGIAPEMPEHLLRWRYPRSLQTWEQNVDVLRNFGTERPHFVRQHIAQQFSLPGTWALTVNVSDASAGYVRINRLNVTDGTPGVSASPYPWRGAYFQNVPVRVAAVPHPGYRFVRWEGTDDGSDSRILLIDHRSAQEVSLTAVFERTDDDGMTPPAHPLAEAPYRFDSWRSDEPAYSYPPNMVFQQTSVEDPGLDDEMESPWTQPYDLESRSRIVGLGDFGIAFINTANPQEAEGSGYVGAAVLALNTEGVDSVFVMWTGATPRPNSRIYHLRMQYRVGSEGPFEDVLDPNGHLVEYRRSPEEGHAVTLGPHPLPPGAAGKPYVQLRWKYYYTGQRADDASGQRTMLRLSDVVVASSKIPVDDGGEQPEHHQLALHQNFPNPFSASTEIPFSIPEESRVRLAVFDLLGREVEVLIDGILSAAEHNVEWHAGDLPSGVYFYRIESDAGVRARKLMILR